MICYCTVADKPLVKWKHQQMELRRPKSATEHQFNLVLQAPSLPRKHTRGSLLASTIVLVLPPFHRYSSLSATVRRDGVCGESLALVLL